MSNIVEFPAPRWVHELVVQYRQYVTDGAAENIADLYASCRKRGLNANEIYNLINEQYSFEPPREKRQSLGHAAAVIVLPTRKS